MLKQPKKKCIIKLCEENLCNIFEIYVNKTYFPFCISAQETCFYKVFFYCDIKKKKKTKKFNENKSENG